MTNEQINRAIAEACGFVCVHEFQVDKSGARFAFWEYPETWTNPKKQPWLPDFCNDLNAMHEACESVFGNSNTWSVFVCEILKALGAGLCTNHDALVIIDRATARQRAEAFLRTLGKWATTEESSVVREEVHP